MTEDEVRRQAIMRYTNGEKPKSIYSDLGRTKQWFFKWLNRYRTGGPGLVSVKVTCNPYKA